MPTDTVAAPADLRLGWTPARDALLIACYGSAPNLAELAYELGVSMCALDSRAKVLRDRGVVLPDRRLRSGGQGARPTHQYPCPRCGKVRPAKRGGIVCRPCRYGPSVDNHTPPPPEEPTDTVPGTQERIAVYEARVEAGRGLWHPRDARSNDE